MKQKNIVIGGNVLQGLTVEGLWLVIFETLVSTYDALMQMGRGSASGSDMKTYRGFG